MTMGIYRKTAFRRYGFQVICPDTAFRNTHIVHTERLDKLIIEVEDAMRRLNAYATQLSDEQVLQFMRQEAESSCKLALGEQPVSFALGADTDDESIEDAENLLKATLLKRWMNCR